MTGRPARGPAKGSGHRRPDRSADGPGERTAAAAGGAMPAFGGPSVNMTGGAPGRGSPRPYQAAKVGDGEDTAAPSPPT